MTRALHVCKFLWLLCFSSTSATLLQAQSGIIPPTVIEVAQNYGTVDEGVSIVSKGKFLYILTNSYDFHWGTELLKYDTETDSVVKKLHLPNFISYPGFVNTVRGYYLRLSSDNQLYVVGQWQDYSYGHMFLSKYNMELELQWANSFAEIDKADAIDLKEFSNGNLTLTYKQYLSGNILNSRVITDFSGAVISNSIILDSTDYYTDPLAEEASEYSIISEKTDNQNYPNAPNYLSITRINKWNLVDWNKSFGYNSSHRQPPINTSLGANRVIAWTKDTSWYDMVTVDSNFTVLYMVDDNGALLWEAEWHVPNYRHKVINLVAAQNGDALGLGSNAPYNPTRSWLFRVNSDGENLWERRYSDASLEPNISSLMPLALCEMDDGRIAITGQISVLIDGAYRAEVYVMVVDSNGCFTPGCDQIDYPLTSSLKPLYSFTSLPNLYVWPNPAAEVFRVQIPESVWTGKNDLTLAAYDVQGRETYRNTVTEAQPSVDASRWPAGAYQLVLLREGTPVAGGKVVVE